MIAVGGRDRRAGNGLQRGGGDEKRQHQAAITSSTARSISAISGSRDRRCSPSFIIHVCTSAERSLLARRSAISNGTSVSAWPWRSEEHTSELQSLMRISYAVFCLE